MELDEAVDCFGAAIAGAAGVEGGQEHLLPLLQRASQPGDLGHGLRDRRGQRRALVAEIGQDGVLGVGPFGQGRPASGWVCRAVVSRPSRAGEVQIGQPSGVPMTWTLPPWAACSPDHHRSTRRPDRSLRAVGPGTWQRPVRISVPSTVTREWPAARAASSTPRSAGARSARTSMPSCS